MYVLTKTNYEFKFEVTYIFMFILIFTFIYPTNQDFGNQPRSLVEMYFLLINNSISKYMLQLDEKST